MDNSHVDVRELVLDILVEHEIKGTYSNVLIRRAQDRHADLALTQRSFLKRLAEGTIERKVELDAVIDRHLRNPQLRPGIVIRCLLRMSIYQIYYMDSVPDHAVCDEAVRICRRRHRDGQAGFVNGLLRSVCREKGGNREAGRRAGTAQPGPLRTKPSDARIVVVGSSFGSAAGADTRAGKVRDDGLARLAETYSMPEEILALWETQLGRERLEPLCRAMLEVRPVCIRLSPRLSPEEKEETLSQIRKTGATLTPGRWMRDCYYLRHAASPVSLPGFSEGRWTVQDESSQLTACAAGLTGRRTDLNGAAEVYDVCAAPGGKTVLAASLLPEGHVTAMDLTGDKTDLIRENIRRMRLDNVTVRENDASCPREDLSACADLVLCDVPCSGLGVITRKRDIKYHMTQQKVRSLVTLQRKIVRNAAGMVKPGGVLLYSTCTINRQENERIADEIEKKTVLMPEDLEPYLPENFPGICGNRVQLFPDIHGTDGFFMARFRRPQNEPQLITPTKQNDADGMK